MAAAAERIGASHSAVSMGISDLESAAGGDLLIRTPRRKLQLTELGSRIFNDARSVVDTADRIESTFRAGLAPSGTVHLSCFNPFSPFVVPDLMAAMAERAPGVELRVTEDPVEQVFPGLLDGTFDVALLYEDRIPAGLEFEPITTHWPYVIVSAEHRLAGADEIDLFDLEPDPFVYVKQRERSYFERLISALGVHPVSQQPTWNMDTVRTMVGRNEAWSILIGPRPMGGASPEGEPIRGVRIANDVPPGRPIMAWSTQVARRPEVELVCDIIPDVFRASRMG